MKSIVETDLNKHCREKPNGNLQAKSEFKLMKKFILMNEIPKT